MEDSDDDQNPVGEALSEFADDALNYDSASDSGEARDVWWLRWLKFISVIAVPAIILGSGFLFEEYIEQNRTGTYSQRQRAERRVQEDSTESMRFRFMMGACIGGGLGLIYVVRCLVRKVDP